MTDSFKRVFSYFRLWLVRLLLRFKAYRYVYYVGSTEVLPPPLTTDEEIYLIRKLENGDMSVKSSLIEHNLRLVVYIAK